MPILTKPAQADGQTALPPLCDAHTHPGEAADEGGPQYQPWDLLPQVLQKGGEALLCPPAVHGLQEPVAAMLEGNVQILNDPGLGGDDPDDLVIEVVRI